MERDATQSMLDEKFPKGANVAIAGGSAFNVARFIVLDETTIRCSPIDFPREVTFDPKGIEERDDGVLVFKEATPSGYDVLVRQAPEAVQDQLVEARTNFDTDEYIDQLRA